MGGEGRMDTGTMYFLLNFAVFEPKTALKIKFINELTKLLGMNIHSRSDMINNINNALLTKNTILFYKVLMTKEQ